MAVLTAPCPECGAPPVEGLSCLEQLQHILAWETQDPELAAQHFFTVACYNLQHPAPFTDEARNFLRSALIDALDHGVPVAELQRRAAARFDGSRRVLKPAEAVSSTAHRWSMTMADVYRPGQRGGTADRVRAWARAICADLSGRDRLRPAERAGAGQTS